MSIQSHGMTHRFLTDLTPEDTDQELMSSKKQIEDEIGSLVDSISFPGGRYSARIIRQARQFDYQWFHTSLFGRNPVRTGSISKTLRRFAVRQNSRPEQIIDYVVGTRWPTMTQHIAEGFRRCARTAMGNQIYHSMYERWARW